MKRKYDNKRSFLYDWSHEYYLKSEEYHNRLKSKWDPEQWSVYEPNFAPYINKVQQLASKNGTVLEIGCGGGQTTYRISSEVRQIIGLDLSVQALKTERPEQPKNVKFVQSDALSLPFSKDTFDVVASYAAFEHFPNVEQALEEGLRVVKANGWLIIFTPNMISPFRVSNLLLRSLRTKKWHPDGRPLFFLETIRLNILKALSLNKEFNYRLPLMADQSFPGSDYDAICLINPFDMLRFANTHHLRILGISQGTSRAGKMIAHWLPWFAGGVGFIAQKPVTAYTQKMEKLK